MRRFTDDGFSECPALFFLNDKDFAWRSFSLKAIERVPYHAWYRLTMLSACLYGVIAALIPGYGWGVKPVWCRLPWLFSTPASCCPDR